MAPQLGPQQDVAHPAFGKMHDLGIQVVRMLLLFGAEQRVHFSREGIISVAEPAQIARSGRAGGTVDPQPEFAAVDRRARFGEDACHQFQGLGQGCLPGISSRSRSFASSRISSRPSCNAVPRSSS